jgi:hypothetical protein
VEGARDRELVLKYLTRTLHDAVPRSEEDSCAAEIFFFAAE